LPALLNRLNPGERRTLGLALGAAVLVLLWFYAWRPLVQAETNARAEALRLGEGLAALRPEIDRLAAAEPRALRFSGSIAAELDRRARDARLDGSLVGIESLSEDRVRIRYKAVAFDVLVGWLEQLERETGIRVAEWSNERVALGFVDGSVVLTR
jgi:type II secretory pathway component PulM